MDSRSACILYPLGIIRTPHTCAEKCPVQPCFARGVRGSVELHPGYAEGLQGIEDFSHLWLIYHLHQSGAAPLVVTPLLTDEPKGVFACRYPSRPNALGLSLVKLLARKRHLLEIEDVDMLDGTPILDIKPYVPRFDAAESANGGWFETLNPAQAFLRGTRSTTLRETCND
jgi:tRNA (adenine37-N6)-methyltransferase